LFEDGVIKLKNFFEIFEIEKVEQAINDVMAKPSVFSSYIEDNNGSFFMDYNNWRRFPSVKEICIRPKTTKFIRSITGSANVWLFHDHVLVKNGKAKETPWHHDRPYYIFKGNLNLSIWTPTVDMPADHGMIFLRGSHKTGKLFVPKSFRDGGDLGLKEGFEKFDSRLLEQFDHITFDLSRGDAILFLNNVLHSAPAHSKNFFRSALSVRYLVGDARLTKKYVNATPPFDKLGVNIEEDGHVPEDKFPFLD
jgi:ectoine hydroxylase-related dioxygenase (phytanoyl-CoA dioxygenase family)